MKRYTVIDSLDVVEATYGDLVRFDDVRELRAYAELLTGLLKKALPEVKAIETEYGDVGPDRLSREIEAALAKNQCGGSGSLSETPRPSTAHPLPAGLKPDKQLDGGPSASGPATQPEPRTICHETNPLRIREWYRSAPDAIGVRFHREVSSEEIEWFPRDLLVAIELRHQSCTKPHCLECSGGECPTPDLCREGAARAVRHQVGRDVDALDAARYRYLRDSHGAPIWHKLIRGIERPADFDEAIDAAIALHNGSHGENAAANPDCPPRLEEGQTGVTGRRDGYVFHNEHGRQIEVQCRPEDGGVFFRIAGPDSESTNQLTTREAAVLHAALGECLQVEHTLDAFQWTGDLDAFGKWFGERWPVDAGGQISVPSGKEGQYLRVWCGSWIIRDGDRCHCVTDEVFRKFIAPPQFNVCGCGLSWRVPSGLPPARDASGRHSIDSQFVAGKKP